MLDTDMIEEALHELLLDLGEIHDIQNDEEFELSKKDIADFKKSYRTILMMQTTSVLNAINELHHILSVLQSQQKHVSGSSLDISTAMSELESMLGYDYEDLEWVYDEDELED